jgi:prepilin-type N-terminal cleavage/methylation domain-containing protein
MKNERGMTLVELVVSIAITGVIVAFLGTAVFQMTTVTAFGNDKLTAMHELQNAAHWFNRDGQQSVAAVVNGSLALTLSDNSSVQYSQVGAELRRTTGGSLMTLARNISGVSFSIDDRLVTMSLISAPPGRYSVTQSGTYKVYLRPTEDGS